MIIKSKISLTEQAVVETSNYPRLEDLSIGTYFRFVEYASGNLGGLMRINPYDEDEFWYRFQSVLKPNLYWSMEKQISGSTLKNAFVQVYNVEISYSKAVE